MTVSRFCLVGLFLLFACTFAGIPTVGVAPVQGWRQDRGPVVPHDSFPDDCRTCHVGGGWHSIREDFAFDHEGQTGVALVGAHGRAECLRCHNDRGPVARFAAQGCAGCHEDWHRRTLGHHCENCHQQQDWKPRRVIAKHALTRFPLTGAHVGAPCWRCHDGAQVGIFERVSTECVVCHRDSLARAVNPDHQTSGWTTGCQRCHSPVGWQGASFAHPFELRGPHRTACANCHTTPGAFLSYSCFTCHEHRQSKMDDDHSSVPGYVYSSPACFSCHPGCRK
jgi:hypothetical protein